MASNDDFDSDSFREHNRRRGRFARGSGGWYCHSCQEEVEPCLPEYICSKCSNGFIEPISTDENSESDLNSEQSMSIASSSSSLSSGQSDSPVPIHQRPIRRGVRRTHIAVHRLQPGATGVTNLQGFIQQLMTGLMGGMTDGGGVGAGGGGPVNIHVAPLLLNVNSGDYVWTGNGLDNIITMLMNQLDNAGPPPAQKDQIDALPTVVVVQEQVDNNVQCHVCMEDFQLDEKVRSLPCRHIYHGDCIIPWLELHGTCPICRKTIETVTESQPSSSSTLPSDDVATLD